MSTTIPSASPDPRAGAWSRYWATGAAHSCPGSFDERLGGAIADFWLQACAGLDSGDRMLEVGAGNGAVSRLVAERGGTPPWIEAVDLADVQPAWLHRLPPAVRERVRFHARTAMERLPFEAGTFKLVASQYAVEYADREAACAEIARCSKPDARLAMVLHHAESEILRTAREERGHIGWLLAPTGLFGTLRALIPDLQRAATPEGLSALRADAAAEARRQRFNALQHELAVRSESAGAADILGEAAETAGQIAAAVARAGAEAAQQGCTTYETALRDADLRLGHLLESALDEPGIQGLAQQLRGHGYGVVEVGTVAVAGKLMGWTVDARRGAGTA